MHKKEPSLFSNSSFLFRYSVESALCYPQTTVRRDFLRKACVYKRQLTKTLFAESLRLHKRQLTKTLSGKLTFPPSPPAYASAVSAFLRLFKKPIRYNAPPSRTSTALNACDTGMDVLNKNNWSVRSPSIQNRPRPYPIRYK